VAARPLVYAPSLHDALHHARMHGWLLRGAAGGRCRLEIAVVFAGGGASTPMRVPR
jgi:hypothetical protein